MMNNSKKETFICKNTLRLTCALVGLLASAANQNVLGHPCPERASDTAVGMAPPRPSPHSFAAGRAAPGGQQRLVLSSNLRTA